MPVRLKRRLLTVEEYHKMGEVGILKEKGLELINGEIIEIGPIGSKHAAIVEKTKDQLYKTLFGKVIIRIQNPIETNKYSELEPDIAVVQFRSDYYVDAHPNKNEIFLIIEVADTSIEYDKEIKLPVYASSGIPEVWIMDVNKQTIEVYHSPIEKRYLNKQILRPDDTISARLIDFSIKVEDLFV